jgi:hypothetical protein
MNALVAPTRADQWQHLKRLVLDSVSSPITHPRDDHRLNGSGLAQMSVLPPFRDEEIFLK